MPSPTETGGIIIPPSPVLTELALLSITAGVALVIREGFIEGDLEALCAQLSIIQNSSGNKEFVLIIEALLALLEALPTQKFAHELEIVKRELGVFANTSRVRKFAVANIKWSE